MNQLFNLLGGNQISNPLLKQFQQFKSSFNGNAQEQVQQMLNSGQVSQEQYNQAVQLANQLKNVLK